jgi:hypothetical protein
MALKHPGRCVVCHRDVPVEIMQRSNGKADLCGMICREMFKVLPIELVRALVIEEYVDDAERAHALEHLDRAIAQRDDAYQDERAEDVAKDFPRPMGVTQTGQLPARKVSAITPSRPKFIPGETPEQVVENLLAYY